MPSLPALTTSGHLAPSVPSPQPSSAGGQGRRVLTPRSPSLRRVASMGQLNAPSATINAQQTPFPPASPRSRLYTIEPGTSGAPPLPTPPAALRQGYGFPSRVAPPPTSLAGRPSPGAGTFQRAPSASVSPSMTYATYSPPPEQISPPPEYMTTRMPPPPTRFSTASESHAQAGPSQERQRPFGIPITSSGGQSTYQMMSLETTSGTVQLPVDVQAASRVADEKRRRNAGASARFRERRKKKEAEASATISKLESQVKDLAEDAEFYKRERDYLMAVVSQMPGGDRHLPRPQSPRNRRVAAPSARHRGARSSAYAESAEQGGSSPEFGRSVRRRTSDYSIPREQAPGAASGPTPMPQPFFGQSAPHQPPSFGPEGQQPQQNLPPGQLMGPLLPSPGPRMGPSGPTMSGMPQSLPPPVMQASPTTGPYNPFAPPRFDRNRPPGPPGQ
ncbi:hypothetical protein M8818_007074 [Zalaria obscura]|uniref:Uncharacterized protein n=1 Tax=Zalaria obscura TaxID=2024903 RepID=A0ACC3S3Y9_9PEZI